MEEKNPEMLDSIVNGLQNLTFSLIFRDDLASIPGKIVFTSKFKSPSGQLCMLVINKVLWYAVRLFTTSALKQESGTKTKTFRMKVGQFLRLRDALTMIGDLETSIKNNEPLSLDLFKEIEISSLKEPLHTKLNGLQDPAKILQPGDHLMIKRKKGFVVYFHHAIYIGGDKIDKQIIHIFRRNEKEPLQVHETSWKEFLLGKSVEEAGENPPNNLEVFVIDYPLKSLLNERIVFNAKALALIFSESDVAMSMNLEKYKYSLISNNCEHFCNFIIFGYAYSTQTRTRAFVFEKKLKIALDLVERALTPIKVNELLCYF